MNREQLIEKAAGAWHDSTCPGKFQENWTPPTDEEWERIIREAREEEFEIHVQQALEIVQKVNG